MILWHEKMGWKQRIPRGDAYLFRGGPFFTAQVTRVLFFAISTPTPGARSCVLANYEFSYPEITAKLFGKDLSAEQLINLQREMDVHWQILLDSEALALTDTRYLRVMQKMWWLGEDVVDLSTPENAEHRSYAPDNKKQHVPEFR